MAKSQSRWPLSGQLAISVRLCSPEASNGLAGRAVSELFPKEQHIRALKIGVKSRRVSVIGSETVRPGDMKDIADQR